MAKEQDNQKLSYKDLEQVAAELQHRLRDAEEALRRMNEVRDMAYLCMQLLEHHEVLPDAMLAKVLAFLDKIIPVPREDNAEEAK